MLSAWCGYSFAVSYPKFLTYPFNEPNVQIYNGWYYYFDGSNHKGVDYNLSYKDLLAAADGVIETVYAHNVQYDTFPTGPNAGTNAYGNHIVINHGNEYKTLYGHMSSFEVTVGQQVVRGQKIGVSGHTGYSTAPHLHFEVRGPERADLLANGYYKYDPYAIYSVDKNLYGATVVLQ